MRKIHAVSTLLLVLAGVAGAAESAALKEFGAGLSEAFAAAERAAHEQSRAALTASDGSPVARSYRAAAIGAAVDAANRQEAVRIAPLNAPGNDAASIGAGLAAVASAAAAEATAKHHATRILAVVETSGVIARDWLGSVAMASIAGAAGEPTLAIGAAAERLAIDGEPVTGAIEGVVRVHVPIAVSQRLSVGPAFSGRAGVTGEGDLVIGLDLFVHAEYSFAPGLGVIADVGAGQRATEHAASDIQPVGSVGLAFVF